MKARIEFVLIMPTLGAIFLQLIENRADEHSHPCWNIHNFRQHLFDLRLRMFFRNSLPLENRRPQRHQEAAYEHPDFPLHEYLFLLSWMSRYDVQLTAGFRIKKSIQASHVGARSSHTSFRAEWSVYGTA